MSYFAVITPSFPLAQNYTIVSQSLSSFSVPIWEVGNYSYYVYAVNEWSDDAFSTKIEVNVIYSCRVHETVAFSALRP
jgi:hypothetical protein